MDEIIPTQLEQNIVNANLIIKSLINDIKTCKGSIEELKKLNEFGRSKISYLRGEIGKLETLAREESDITVKKRLLIVVQSEKDQFHGTLKDFQKANVECMISIEKSNSEELFAVSNSDEVLRRRYARNNASLIQQSAEISDHMSSISRRLADVVKENSGTLETLVKSSTNITGVQSELKTTGSIIDQSGKILNKYQQRERILYASHDKGKRFIIGTERFGAASETIQIQEKRHIFCDGFTSVVRSCKETPQATDHSYYICAASTINERIWTKREENVSPVNASPLGSLFSAHLLNHLSTIPIKPLQN